MKDLEKQIEEAANDYSNEEHGVPRDWQSVETTEIKFHFNIVNSFIEGAKSHAAKEYWQQGMYSEEQVENILIEYSKSEYSKISRPIKFFSKYKRKNYENKS